MGRSRGTGAFYRCFQFDLFNVPPARATSQNRDEEATSLKDLSVPGGCDTLDLVLAASNNVCAERTRLSKYRINKEKKSRFLLDRMSVCVVEGKRASVVLPSSISEPVCFKGRRGMVNTPILFWFLFLCVCVRVCALGKVGRDY